jgi:hypothetical protein
VALPTLPQATAQRVKRDFLTMKKSLLIPLVLVGCATAPPPPQPQAPPVSYMHPSPPPVQLVLDARVQQMSRHEVIQATHDCEENGMRAALIYSKRLVSGMMSDIVIDVHCTPKPRFSY